MAHFKSIVAIWAFALFAHNCLAANEDFTDLSLEQLMEVKVISASKFNQSASNAPSAVQVITREEIRRHGWRTLTDALNTLPGLYASNDRTYDFQGSRGFQVPGDYNSRFLLLIDGQRNNDNIYQQALTGNEGWVDMSSVDRIEYIPGPGSSIYGSNAMFGVINVITRKAEATSKRQVDVRLSTLGESGLNLVSSQQFAGAEQDTGLFMQLSTERKTGRDQQYFDPMGQLLQANGAVSPDGVAHGLDSNDNRHLLVRADRGEWTFRMINHERTVHPSSAPYFTLFNDPSIMINDGGTQLNASVDHALTDISSITARLGYTDWHYRGNYPFLDPVIGYYHNHDDYRGRMLDGEFHYQTVADAHHLLAGLDFNRDFQAQQHNFNSTAVPGAVSVNLNPLVTHVGMFLQDEWRMSPNWILNLGGRIDNATNQANKASPRIGLIWQPAAAWTFKLLGGKAYRSPNAYESQYTDGVNYLSNPNLKSETINSSEAVVEWLRNDQTRWQLSLYQNQVHNLIRQVNTNGMLQFQNLGQANSKGLELGVEKSHCKQLKVARQSGQQLCEYQSGQQPEMDREDFGKCATVQ